MCGLKRHLGGKNGDEALNPLDAHDRTEVRKTKHFVFACLVLFISGIVSLFI